MIRTLTGDCRTLLPTLPAGSVDCVCTSPPYYGLRSYLPNGHDDKHREIGLEASPDAYVAVMVAVFREVRRVLKDDGTVWLNLGDSYNSAPVGRFNGGSQAIRLLETGARRRGSGRACSIKMTAPPSSRWANLARLSSGRNCAKARHDPIDWHGVIISHQFLAIQMKCHSVFPALGRRDRKAQNRPIPLRTQAKCKPQFPQKSRG